MLHKANDSNNKKKDVSVTPQKKDRIQIKLSTYTEASTSETQIEKQQFMTYIQAQVKKINSTRSEMSYSKEKLKDQNDQEKILQQQLDEIQKQNQDYKLQLLQLEMEIKNYLAKIEQIQNDPQLQELKKENKKIFHELRLETQNRQILQNQVEQLCQEKQKLYEENNQLRLKNTKKSLPSNEGSLHQTQNLKLQSELQTLRQKYEELENKYSSERQEKDLLLYRLNSPSCHSKQKLQPSTPERRQQSPILRLSPKQEKKKLEIQLEYAQINKLNIEKVLEVKFLEFNQKEQVYLEKIARLEKQLKSRIYFEQDKRPQMQELENANANYKSQIEKLKISYQAQILELNNQINVLRNQKGQIEQTLKQLQYDKLQQDKRYAEQIETIKQLKKQNQSLNVQSTREIQELKQQVLENEKVSMEKLIKANNEIQDYKQQEFLYEKEMEKLKNQLQYIQNELKTFKQDNQMLTEKLKSEIDNCNEQLKVEKQKFEKQSRILHNCELNLKVSLLENENNRKLIKHLQSVTNNSNWELEINRLQDLVNGVENDVTAANSKENEEELKLQLYRIEKDIKSTRDDVYIFETDMNEYLSEQLKNLQEYVQELDCGILFEKESS